MGAPTMTAPRLGFELPRELEAEAPPAVRDDLRLLVAWRSSGRLLDTSLARLPGVLRRGDLLVLNRSATVPAAVPVSGTNEVVHLATPLPDERWIVELRRPDGFASVPADTGVPGRALALPGGAQVRLAEPWGESRPVRLWVAEVALPQPLLVYLARHGRPIRYGYVTRPWPLQAYQTVYADEPGSAEMPSAGRGLTPGLLARLVRSGVGIAKILLHTGLSSPEAGERPQPERYRVDARTAERVNRTRAGGGRVVAVGTTVTRALETVAGPDGRVRPGAGWTELVVTPERGVRAVDGLLTGWHEPRASHLDLLEAIAGRELLAASYAAALRARYRWHEFGDLHLILP